MSTNPNYRFYKKNCLFLKVWRSCGVHRPSEVNTSNFKNHKFLLDVSSLTLLFHFAVFIVKFGIVMLKVLSLHLRSPESDRF